MARLVLVTGIPGVGKSTVSKLLAESFSRSVRISGDDLRHLVISGYRDPSGQWYGETQLQYYLSFKNGADLARNFLEKGFDVVIDDVVRVGDLYDEWLKHFAGLEYTVVLLMPSLKTALRRNRERPEKTVPEETLRDLHERYQQTDNAGWIVIDNSGQSEQETLREILSRLN